MTSYERDQCVTNKKTGAPGGDDRGIRLLLKALENPGFSSLLHKRPEILQLKALRICWTHSKFLQRWRILENLQDFQCA